MLKMNSTIILGEVFQKQAFEHHSVNADKNNLHGNAISPKFEESGRRWSSVGACK